MPRQNQEEIESKILATYLRNNNYTFTHIANESGLPPKVAMRVAIKHKAMWLTPWVPDYMIVLKRSSLLFIELKKKRTRKKNGEYKALSTDWISISEHQERWQNELNQIPNVQCEICFWADEALELILKLEQWT